MTRAAKIHCAILTLLLVCPVPASLRPRLPREIAHGLVSWHSDRATFPYTHGWPCPRPLLGQKTLLSRFPIRRRKTIRRIRMDCCALGNAGCGELARHRLAVRSRPLRSQCNARKPNPLSGLLHGSADTRVGKASKKVDAQSQPSVIPSPSELPAARSGRSKEPRSGMRKPGKQKPSPRLPLLLLLLLLPVGSRAQTATPPSPSRSNDVVLLSLQA